MPMNTVAPKVIVIPAKLELTERKRLHCQLRVAAYCRVSTDDEEQLTSYEAQQTYYTITTGISLTVPLPLRTMPGPI